ncbi:LAME_0F03774g1_1 [Lachancea meyersii CBS 8951]|uniref:LAME_0F03774g1_1 n=1 Tax=Lachancea meyersii CBS 8951 TaxID=1266667 RepID=A0A1G4JRH5_9SACH|nr:LAME_0F03774g1_1 [Lachancea meyersii CBS 8951]
MPDTSEFRKTTRTVDAVSPRSSKLSTLDSTKDVLKVVYDVYESQWTATDSSLVNFVFLHGSGMNRKVWDDYVDKLNLPANKRGWRIGKVVLIDQVNHGDSAVLNEPLLGTIYDWSDGARDVCKICADEFYNGSRKNGTFNVVVGHSMGGFQALCCSVLFPGIFDTVLCIEPVVWMKRVRNAGNDDITIMSPTFYKALAATMQDEFSSQQHFDRYFDKSSLYAASDPVIKKRERQFELQKLTENVFRTKTNARQHMLTYLTLNPTATWLMKSLPFINCPVACIYGSKSKWCPPENRHYLRNHIKGYQEVEVDGGHLINIESPASVIGNINTSLSKLLPKETEKSGLDADARQSKFDSDYKTLLKERVMKGTPKL